MKGIIESESVFAGDDKTKSLIESGRAVLGIELGSTRVKAVLTDDKNRPVASGECVWENKLENSYWTYSESDIRQSLAAAYQSLRRDVNEKYGTQIRSLAAVGISAMMHGYLAFDGDDRLLVPFRTWRNTSTAEASDVLTSSFGFHIPQRWSAAHFYQAMLNGESHVSHVRHLNTLAGHVHFLLTGRRVLGIGDASGMFPVNPVSGDYDEAMLQKFNRMADMQGICINMHDILPEVLPAGVNAGCLTDAGAALLDTSGQLNAGAPLCPPEGDAGTGMTATNSVAPGSGNISAGTSAFAMIVLGAQPSKCRSEIDVVTTPSGDPVAMVHCNNCTSELNGWVGIFGEFASALGANIGTDELYSLLYGKATEGEADCGGLLAYNYLSGEHITGLDEGRPMYLRTPGSRLTLANFMRAELYSSLSVIKIGMEILKRDENMHLERITGHGGLFKTAGVAQQLLADALDVPTAVMETAGEGGAWGIALLASYMLNGRGRSLEKYLKEDVFADAVCSECMPDDAGRAGFDAYIARYKAALPAERAAAELLK